VDGVIQILCFGSANFILNQNYLPLRQIYHHWYNNSFCLKF